MSVWLVIFSVAVPLCGAVAVWLASGRPRLRDAVAMGFAVTAGLGTLVMLPAASPDVAVRLPLGEPFGDLTFVADGLGAFMAAICTVIGAVVVVYSVGDLRGEASLGRYFALVLLFIGSMSALTLAGSLLLLVVAWEIVGLCSFGLIAHYTDRPAAVAGGIRALVITQVGGVGLLVGALVAGAYLGSYDTGALIARAGELPAPALAIVAFGFLVAAAAKSAQVPLHSWLPGAMEAPTPISALIHAATMVNAGVYLLARFEPAFAGVPGWSVSLILVGLTSTLLGGLLALAEHDLKRALAYSTVSQLGLLVVGVGLSATFASQLHLLSHAVFKALLFLTAGAVIHAVGTRDMRLMGGLGPRLPFARAAFIVGTLGLAGLPIANGFWSKDLLLAASVEHGAGWLTVGLLGATALTALYGIRLVWLVFWGPAPAPAAAYHPAPLTVRGSLGLLAIATLTSWLLAGPLGRLLAIQAGPPAGEALGTWALVEHVVTSPATLLSLAAVGLGLALWLGRAGFGSLTAALGMPADALRAGAGFEHLNARVVQMTGRLSDAVGRTQTGHLSWNVLGLVGALLAVLLVLAREV